jgi:hypothetical protein
LSDSRKADRKRSWTSDLTLELVEQLLTLPCSYCGDSKGRMTLDRVDNSIGHLASNLVPACLRCNYVRRDMPYQAWLIVARGMKEANEKGLFGSWWGRARMPV